MSGKRENRDEKLDRELRDHLQLDAEAKMDRGLRADEARYAAQREFGNTTLVKEVKREIWRWSFLERIIQDVRYGLRVFFLRRNPGIHCRGDFDAGAWNWSKRGDVFHHRRGVAASTAVSRCRQAHFDFSAGSREGTS